MKYFFLVILVAILSINTEAQQRSAHLSFRKVDHSFGKIKEAAGPVTVIFSFINTGGAPLLLQDVSSTCGCTTPEYTKAPVMPGDSGFVKAIYNPSGRPGPFTKDITVKSNADNAPIVLRIKGEVEPREMKMEEQYRYTMGNLKLETSHLSYGRIYFGETRVLKLKLINTGKIPVKLSYKNLPAYLKVKDKIVMVKPNEPMEIEYTYDTKARNDWGFLIDYLYFLINDKEDPTYKVTVTADISENFARLTDEQRKNAPFIEFDDPNYDFKTVKEGTPVDHLFTFTNKGKSDLIIRKVSSSCGCAVAALDTKVVKPGKNGVVKVTFKTNGYRDLQSKPITIISNDPNASNITLTIKGTVLPAN